MRKFLFTLLSFILTAILLSCGVTGEEQSDLGIRFVMETDPTGCPPSGLESATTGYQKNKLPNDVASLNFMLYDRDDKQLVPTTNIRVTNNCNNFSLN